MKTTFVCMLTTLILAFPFAQGCSSVDKHPVMEHGKVISEVEITGPGATMRKDTEKQLTSVVKYSDGSSTNITKGHDAVWNTSDPAVATVNQKGVVQAIKEGPVTISVTYNGKTDSTTFVVIP